MYSKSPPYSQQPIPCSPAVQALYYCRHLHALAQSLPLVPAPVSFHRFHARKQAPPTVRPLSLTGASPSHRPMYSRRSPEAAGSPFPTGLPVSPLPAAAPRPAIAKASKSQSYCLQLYFQIYASYNYTHSEIKIDKRIICRNGTLCYAYDKYRNCQSIT